jgi:hypothetical protein
MRASAPAVPLNRRMELFPQPLSRGGTSLSRGREDAPKRVRKRNPVREPRAPSRRHPEVPAFSPAGRGISGAIKSEHETSGGAALPALCESFIFGSALAAAVPAFPGGHEPALKCTYLNENPRPAYTKMCKSQKPRLPHSPANVSLLMPDELPNWLLFMDLKPKKSHAPRPAPNLCPETFCDRQPIPQAFPQAKPALNANPQATESRVVTGAAIQVFL